MSYIASMPSVVARAVVILVAAGALGLAVNAVRPGGVAVTSYQAPTQCASGGEAAATGPEEVPPGEAATWCGQPDVVIGDHRVSRQTKPGE